MSRILILFAHPLLEKSRVQFELVKTARQQSQVTINDLYEVYPDFDIDIKREQELLLQHDIVIWQHPFYWYSAPAILKQWQDLVLEHGWAYGKKGVALSGKKVFNVLTSGGGMEAYREGGFNKYAIHEFLRPFQRTAELCKMTYLPPFWIHGVHKMESGEIRNQSHLYGQLLKGLARDQFPDEQLLQIPMLNNLVSNETTVG